jgi:hypothetical protein
LIRALVIATTFPFQSIGATSDLKGFFPDHFPWTAIALSVAENCEWELSLHRFINFEFSKASNAASSMVISSPHRLGSASRGVKVSPFPVPRSFQKPIELFRFSARLSSAIRKIAQRIFELLIFQKYIWVIT